MYRHIRKNSAAEHNLQHNVAVAASVCQAEMRALRSP